MGAEHDRWMQRWLPQLRAAAGDGPVLELGCDTGGDTAWLLDQGLPVVAADIALEALRELRRRAGAGEAGAAAAHLLRLDLRRPLPFADAAFGAAVASLSLHYFDWATTERAVAEIRRCLRPAGLLLCRLNSTADVLHGATGHEEIEPRFYRVNARYAETKRFFDRADVERLFAGWTVRAVEETAVLRYAQPKVAWEVVLHAR